MVSQSSIQQPESQTPYTAGIDYISGLMREPNVTQATRFFAVDFFIQLRYSCILHFCWFTCMESRTILDSTPGIQSVEFRFQILIIRGIPYCFILREVSEDNITRAVFRIQEPRISDSTSKYFRIPESTSKNLLDFEIQIS